MFIMHLLTPTLGKIGIRRGRGGNRSRWVGFGFERVGSNRVRAGQIESGSSGSSRIGFERVESNRVRVQVRAGRIGFGFKFERVGLGSDSSSSGSDRVNLIKKIIRSWVGLGFGSNIIEFF
jgi:hypothetical protein